MAAQTFLLFMLLVFVVVVQQGNQTNTYYPCKTMTIDCYCGKDEPKLTFSLYHTPKITKLLDNDRTECAPYPNPYHACRNENHTCYHLPPNRTAELQQIIVDALVRKFPSFVQSVRRDRFRNRRQIKAKEKEEYDYEDEEYDYEDEEYDYEDEEYDYDDEEYDYDEEEEKERPCHVEPVQFSRGKCQRGQDWVICEMSCVDGSAMLYKNKLAMSGQFTCKYDENVWRPHKFLNCKPFVHCKANLIKPGNMTCDFPIDKPGYCNISCAEHDGFKATAKQRYECNKNFSENLPHCVEDLSDTATILPPTINFTIRSKM